MHTEIRNIVEEYPKNAQQRFGEIRSLIFDIAKNNELGEVTETLKWGEPSYLCKTGSTVRISWREKDPDNIGIFFNCNTKLVETFKEVFQDNLSYEGNRVVVVPLKRKLPQDIESCLLMTLNYHKLKKLPLLGA